jgi:thiamine-phosphate pyrophosphorylase
MNLVFPSLYAIISAGIFPGAAEEWTRRLAEAGVEIIQYRDKQASSRQLFETARRLAVLASGLSFRFILNDRPDVAALAGAGGVHVGQEDLAVEQARRICGEDCWVGVSTHTMEQLQAAALTSADYIAVGPVFSTATKAGHEPVVGVEFIRRARKLTHKPLVAIGGITAERAADAYRAGADCVAVASDLVRPGDLAARVREYLEVARTARGAADDVSGNAGGPSKAPDE